MKRRCKWCDRMYNTEGESSIFCADNPHRGRGEKRWRKGRKPFVILMLPSSIKRLPTRRIGI